MRRTLEMFPDQLPTRHYFEMAEVYEQKRMFAETFAARQHGLSKEPGLSRFVSRLAEAYKHAGYNGWLLKSAQSQEQDPRALHVCPVHEYALLNDEAHATTCLEQWYEAHVVAILFIRTAPELDSIRSSPRFRAWVHRLGFPPSASDNN